MGEVHSVLFALYMILGDIGLNIMVAPFEIAGVLQSGGFA